jgi:hypothetical protein
VQDNKLRSEKTNDYENFEKGMIYMKILKKGGVVEKRGEEETKSMPHAGNPRDFYTFYLVYIWHCRINLFLRYLPNCPCSNLSRYVGPMLSANKVYNLPTRIWDIITGMTIYSLFFFNTFMDVMWIQYAVETQMWNCCRLSVFP